MKKVQFISYFKIGHKEKENYDISFSQINNAYSFDDYDLNIISLNDAELWSYNGSYYDSIDSFNDILHLSKMIVNSKKGKVLVLLPSNFQMNQSYMGHYDAPFLKDNISLILKVLNSLMNTNLKDLSFENNWTQTADFKFESSFVFDNSEFSEDKVYTTSTSGKITSVIIDGHVISAIKIEDINKDLLPFLDMYYNETSEYKYPEWLQNYNFSNEEQQKKELEENTSRISELNRRNIEIEQILEKNNKTKSILIESGDRLLTEVFIILEKLFNCKLDKFEDKNKEDFLIQYDDFDFVGEIKGVSKKNVKQSNITQTELHLHSHKEKLEEENIMKSSKGILIINYNRNSEVKTRLQIEKSIVELAKARDCLIITTHTLLLLYEKILNNDLDSETIISKVKEKKGELLVSDFENSNKSF